MSTESAIETVRGLPVHVVRKPIKNLHLGVYPPDGRVRVAAPEGLSDDAVRVAVVRKLGWIRRQQARFRAQARESRRDFVSGETHYYLGRRYLLRVMEARSRPRVRIAGRYLELTCRSGATREKRAEILDGWYREQLKQLVPPLVAAWQPKLGVEVADWRVRRMKTKWASCNPATRRLWFNSELAKKPKSAVEYLVVHELLHLLHRRHDAPFMALLDEHLPKWRSIRIELGQLPLTRDWWPED